MQARLAGPNALDPKRMTPDERLAEIGRTLGAALVRLHTGQSRSLSEDNGESCLDLPACQRRHAERAEKRKA